MSRQDRPEPPRTPEQASAHADSGAAEEWFESHGLPWFVDSRRRRVERALGRWRLALVGVALLVVCPGVGVAVARYLHDGADGVVVATQLLAVGLLLYALAALDGWAIAKWAARRTFSSLGLLVPLVTRALPLLLLFVTFLFINAEVWQVSAGLGGRVMWLVILLFLVVTVGFLLVRLPEEMAIFDRDIAPPLVVEGTLGTPLQEAARRYPDLAFETRDAIDDLEGLQKINLVVMLVLAQLVQVLLLFATMLCFFVVFGLLIMRPDVVEAWTGQDVVHGLFGFDRFNRELLRVSIFLAAFSGLYFTVYAVTDEAYRTQFFTSLVKEMQRALAVRAAYRMLRDVEMRAQGA